MIRKVDKLNGGETNNLTMNYWTLKSIVLDKHSTDEDVYNSNVEYVPVLNDDELKYFYWELVYLRGVSHYVRGHVELMKEYLITEFMNRKRGECDEKTVY